MGAKKFPVRFRYYYQSVGAATSVVRSERLKRGKIIACQSIAFRNRNAVAGNVEIFIEHEDVYTFICDQTTPAANRWYWYPFTQFIKLGEQISAFQAACEADDILDLHIIGYTTYGEENVLPRGGH